MPEKSECIALEFAGFWRRLAAFLIDFVALSVILSIFASPQWFSLVSLWDVDEIFARPMWLVFPYLVFSNLLSLLVGIAYFVAFWVWRGQTPGKMALSIKLIRTDGSNVTIGDALLRYLGYFVSAAILFIGFIWIAFDSRKQGLHDKIADTYVVKIPRVPVTITRTSPSASG